MAMDTDMALMRSPKQLVDRRSVHWARLTAFFGAALLPVMASAQVFNFSPTLETRLTFSDNLRADNSQRRSGWVMEVNPGLGGGLNREGGRAQLRFNAGLTNLGYGSDGGRRSPGVVLDAAGEVEAIESLLFINADASIQRSSLSPFGGRPRGDFLNDNRDNESRSFSLSPRLEFSLGALANASMQYQLSWLSGGANTLNSVRQQSASTLLTSARMFGPLDWTLSHRLSSSAYQGATDGVTTESVRASLRYAVTPLFRLRAVVGRESNDFGNGSTQRSGINGGGFDWNPSPRTTVSATLEDRFFGRGYDVSFSHRMARSALQISLGRDNSSSAQRFGSVYADPFFSVFFNTPALFRPDLTDPQAREEALKEFLGIGSDSSITNAQFVDRFVRVSYTLTGLRNSVSVGYAQSTRTSLTATTGLRPDDVFRDSTRLDSQEWSLSVDHRFTPRSGLTAAFTQSEVERYGAVSERTRRNSYALTYTTSLGHRTSGGLTYRHQRSTGSGQFSENALSANVSMRF